MISMSTLQCRQAACRGTTAGGGALPVVTFAKSGVACRQWPLPIFIRNPAASHANHPASRALQALVTMSCTAELRALSLSRHTLKILQWNSRSSQNAVRSRAAPKCTQCQACYSTLSLRPTLLYRKPSRSPQVIRPQNVRFISKVALKTKHRAFVALGSNMGDRIAMIEQACKEMEASGNIKILRTSSLWETKAMYVVEQDKFVNGACEVGRTDSLLHFKYANVHR